MNACEQLGLGPNATPDEVKTHWRRLASVHHPDHGGDAIEFDRLRQLYKEVMAEASAPRSCELCQGTGRVPSMRGFYTINLACAACGGTGIPNAEGVKDDCSNAGVGSAD